MQEKIFNGEKNSFKDNYSSRESLQQIKPVVRGERLQYKGKTYYLTHVYLTFNLSIFHSILCKPLQILVFAACSSQCGRNTLAGTSKGDQSVVMKSEPARPSIISYVSLARDYDVKNTRLDIKFKFSNTKSVLKGIFEGFFSDEMYI